MSSSTDAMSALWGTDSNKPAAEKKAAAPKSSAKPKPAAEKKAAAPKSSAKPKPAAEKKAAAPKPSAKPKPEPKPAKQRKPVKKAASTKPADHSALEGVSRFNGLRGAKLETFGKASRSAMMRVAAEFQEAATKVAKRDGTTLVEITRALVKHVK